jgi:hypothetical protein
MRTGPLEKLVIRAFRDIKVNDDEIGSFTVPINPENLEEDLKIIHDRNQHQGAEGNDLRYKGTAPRKLSLKLLFDNSGTVEGNRMEGVPVPEQLNAFRAVVSDMDPVSHKPPYLKVTYNKFVFDGVLSNLKIQYTLFDSVGVPIRARVIFTAEEFKEPKKRVKEEDKQSPDLTHLRKVKEGDNLPLMTFQIYGNAEFFLQVARENKLNNFRKLQVGSEVVFPPIDKEING